MKIELKKLKISEHLSEETTAFTADIYVNNKLAGYAKNYGHGGCTYYHAYEGKHSLINDAEKHCLTLPKKIIDMGGGRESFEIEMNLENFIDELVIQAQIEKEQKKLEKKMLNTIMWGVPGGYSYKQVKFSVPLAQIPVLQLQEYINKYKKEFKEGEQFLNNNLESLGIKL